MLNNFCIDAVLLSIVFLNSNKTFSWCLTLSRLDQSNAKHTTTGKPNSLSNPCNRTISTLTPSNNFQIVVNCVAYFVVLIVYPISLKKP